MLKNGTVIQSYNKVNVLTTTFINLEKWLVRDKFDGKSTISINFYNLGKLIKVKSNVLTDQRVNFSGSNNSPNLVVTYSEIVNGKYISTDLDNLPPTQIGNFEDVWRGALRICSMTLPFTFSHDDTRVNIPPLNQPYDNRYLIKTNAGLGVSYVAYTYDTLTVGNVIRDYINSIIDPRISNDVVIQIVDNTVQIPTKTNANLTYNLSNNETDNALILNDIFDLVSTPKYNALQVACTSIIGGTYHITLSYRTYPYIINLEISFGVFTQVATGTIYAYELLYKKAENYMTEASILYDSNESYEVSFFYNATFVDQQLRNKFIIDYPNINNGTTFEVRLSLRNYSVTVDKQINAFDYLNVGRYNLTVSDLNTRNAGIMIILANGDYGDENVNNIYDSRFFYNGILITSPSTPFSSYSGINPSSKLKVSMRLRLYFITVQSQQMNGNYSNHSSYYLNGLDIQNNNVSFYTDQANATYGTSCRILKFYHIHDSTTTLITNYNQLMMNIPYFSPTSLFQIKFDIIKVSFDYTFTFSLNNFVNYTGSSIPQLITTKDVDRSNLSFASNQYTITNVGSGQTIDFFTVIDHIKTYISLFDNVKNVTILTMQLNGGATVNVVGWSNFWIEQLLNGYNAVSVSTCPRAIANINIVITSSNINFPIFVTFDENASYGSYTPVGSYTITAGDLLSKQLSIFFDDVELNHGSGQCMKTEFLFNDNRTNWNDEIARLFTVLPSSTLKLMSKIAGKIANVNVAFNDVVMNGVTPIIGNYYNLFNPFYVEQMNIKALDFQNGVTPNTFLLINQLPEYSIYTSKIRDLIHDNVPDEIYNLISITITSSDGSFIPSYVGEPTYPINSIVNDAVFLSSLYNLYYDLGATCTTVYINYYITLLFNDVDLEIYRDDLNGNYVLTHTLTLTMYDIRNNTVESYLNQINNQYGVNCMFDLQMYFNNVLITDNLIPMEKIGIYDTSTLIKINMTHTHVKANISFTFTDFNSYVIPNYTQTYIIPVGDLVMPIVTPYYSISNTTLINFTIQDIRDHVELFTPLDTSYYRIIEIGGLTNTMYYNTQQDNEKLFNDDFTLFFTNTTGSCITFDGNRNVDVIYENSVIYVEREISIGVMSLVATIPITHDDIVNKTARNIMSDLFDSIDGNSGCQFYYSFYFNNTLTLDIDYYLIDLGTIDFATDFRIKLNIFGVKTKLNMSFIDTSVNNYAIPPITYKYDVPLANVTYNNITNQYTTTIDANYTLTINTLRTYILQYITNNNFKIEIFNPVAGIFLLDNIKADNDTLFSSLHNVYTDEFSSDCPITSDDYIITVLYSSDVPLLVKRETFPFINETLKTYYLTSTDYSTQNANYYITDSTNEFNSSCPSLYDVEFIYNSVVQTNLTVPLITYGPFDQSTEVEILYKINSVDIKTSLEFYDIQTPSNIIANLVQDINVSINDLQGNIINNLYVYELLNDPLTMLTIQDLRNHIALYYSIASYYLVIYDKNESSPTEHYLYDTSTDNNKKLSELFVNYQKINDNCPKAYIDLVVNVIPFGATINIEREVIFGTYQTETPYTLSMSDATTRTADYYISQAYTNYGLGCSYTYEFYFNNILFEDTTQLLTSYGNFDNATTMKIIMIQQTAEITTEIFFNALSFPNSQGMPTINLTYVIPRSGVIHDNLTNELVMTEEATPYFTFTVYDLILYVRDRLDLAYKYYFYIHITQIRNGQSYDIYDNDQYRYVKFNEIYNRFDNAPTSCPSSYEFFSIDIYLSNINNFVFVVKENSTMFNFSGFIPGAITYPISPIDVTTKTFRQYVDDAIPTILSTPFPCAYSTDMTINNVPVSDADMNMIMYDYKPIDINDFLAIRFKANILHCTLTIEFNSYFAIPNLNYVIDVSRDNLTQTSFYYNFINTPNITPVIFMNDFITYINQYISPNIINIANFTIQDVFASDPSPHTFYTENDYGSELLVDYINTYFSTAGSGPYCFYAQRYYFMTIDVDNTPIYIVKTDGFGNDTVVDTLNVGYAELYGQTGNSYINYASFYYGSDCTYDYYFYMNNTIITNVSDKLYQMGSYDETTELFVKMVYRFITLNISIAITDTYVSGITTLNYTINTTTSNIVYNNTTNQYSIILYPSFTTTINDIVNHIKTFTPSSYNQLTYVKISRSPYNNANAITHLPINFSDSFLLNHNTFTRQTATCLVALGDHSLKVEYLSVPLDIIKVNINGSQSTIGNIMVEINDILNNNGDYFINIVSNNISFTNGCTLDYAFYFDNTLISNTNDTLITYGTYTTSTILKILCTDAELNVTSHFIFDDTSILNQSISNFTHNIIIDVTQATYDNINDIYNLNTTNPMLQLLISTLRNHTDSSININMKDLTYFVITDTINNTSMTYYKIDDTDNFFDSFNTYNGDTLQQCLTASRNYNVAVDYVDTVLLVEREITPNVYMFVGSYSLTINDLINNDGLFYKNIVDNDYGNSCDNAYNIYFNNVAITDDDLNLIDYGAYDLNTDLKIQIKSQSLDVIINMVFNDPSLNTIITQLTITKNIPISDVTYDNITNKYQISTNPLYTFTINDIRNHINTFVDVNIQDLITISITKGITVSYYNTITDNQKLFSNDFNDYDRNVSSTCMTAETTYNVTISYENIELITKIAIDYDIYQNCSSNVLNISNIMNDTILTWILNVSNICTSTCSSLNVYIFKHENTIINDQSKIIYETGSFNSNTKLYIEIAFSTVNIKYSLNFTDVYTSSIIPTFNDDYDALMEDVTYNDPMYTVNQTSNYTVIINTLRNHIQLYTPLFSHGLMYFTVTDVNNNSVTYMNNSIDNNKKLIESFNVYEKYDDPLSDCIFASTTYESEINYENITINVVKETQVTSDIIGTYTITINDLLSKNGQYYINQAINDFGNSLPYETSIYFNGNQITDLTELLYQYGLYDSNTELNVIMFLSFDEVVTVTIYFIFKTIYSALDDFTITFTVNYTDLVQIDVNKFILSPSLEPLLYVRDIRNQIINQINNVNIYNLIIIIIDNGVTTRRFYDNDEDNNTSLNDFLIIDMTTINTLRTKNNKNRYITQSRDIVTLFSEYINIIVEYSSIPLNIFIINECNNKVQISSYMLNIYELTTRTPQYYITIANDDVYNYYACNSHTCNNVAKCSKNLNVSKKHVIFKIDNDVIKSNKYNEHISNIQMFNVDSVIEIHII
jgi:hypothetical protein